LHDATNSTSGLENLGDYLRSEHDFELINEALATLRHNPQKGEITSVAQLTTYVEALDVIRTVISALIAVPHPEAGVDEHLNKTQPLLLEHWTSIVRWMAYIIEAVPVLTSRPSEKGGLEISSTLLLAMLAPDTEYTQALYEDRQTLHLIFSMLRMRNELGRYQNLRKGQDRPVCQMMRLLFNAVNVCPDAIIEFINGLGSKDRKAVAKSLVGRVGTFTYTGYFRLDDYESATLNLTALIGSCTTMMRIDETIERLLCRHNFVFECTTALSFFCMIPFAAPEVVHAQLALSSFVLASMHFPKQGQEAIRGGVFQNALRTLAAIPADGALYSAILDGVLVALAPLLTTSHCALALQEKPLDAFTLGRARSAKSAKILDMIERLTSTSCSLFLNGSNHWLSVNMCYNLKVKI